MSKLIEAPSRFLWKKEATTWTSIHIYHCRLHDDDIDHINHIDDDENEDEHRHEDADRKGDVDGDQG